jgi:benzoate/toluate 1,2-dioxygenase subunit beta
MVIASLDTANADSSFENLRARTSHNISNVEIISQIGERVDLRFNWMTLSYRYKAVDTYFGASFYTLDIAGERPVIKAKKVILKNDCIHHVIDVYHV